MQRRDFIRSSMAAAALTVLGGHQLKPVRVVHADELAQPFSKKLLIPPLLEKTKTDSNSAFVFHAGKSSREFLARTETATLGYNGSFLGPTIRVREDEQVRFRISNQLDEVTTVHWHGLHVPARWDGGPHQVIQPGSVWQPEFRIKQQAATLWYHPHAMGLTGEHVYRGLAGLFIIDDDLSDGLPLPRAYGVDDIPLIVQDRRFYEDGSFAYIRSMHDVMHGVVGNYLLVNGMLSPVVQVARGITRFRVLNGSNSSIYRFRLSGDRSMHVIGSDGGLLERPAQATEVVLSAGERAEILVDCTRDQPGDKVRLYVDQYGGASHEALEIQVTAQRGKELKVPGYLREQTPLDVQEAETVRHFSMETMSARGGGMGVMGGQRLTINGRKMDINRIDERIRLGSTELWEIVNTSASMMRLPHSMHLHDVQFNILDRNGKPPAPIEAGRKDTVLLWPNDRVRILARFEDYTGIYMYHCHMLEHEDDGMMGQFEVVADLATV